MPSISFTYTAIYINFVIAVLFLL